MALKDLIPHQFKPGQSGNPGGRPKSSRLRDDLIRLIRDKELGPKLMDKLAEMAMEGDIRAMAMILDRIDGKVPDRIEVGADSTQTLRDFLDDDTPDAAPPAARRKAKKEAGPPG